MHTKSYFLLSVLLLLATSFYSQVGIGTTTPSPAAMLEVSSQVNGSGVYRGLMPPRVPDVAALSAMAPGFSDTGLMVFVEDNGNGKACLLIWDGYLWKNGICFVINTPPEIRDLEILGPMRLDGIVNADYTYYDADADPAGAHIFKWYRADDASGTGQSLITDETTDTYEIVATDVGKFLAVEVTPLATSGLSPGTPVMSPYRGPVSIGPEWPAIQNFEDPHGLDFELPLLSVSGGSHITGNNSGRPTTARYVSPSRGYSVSNGTATLELGPIDASSAADATFKLRVGGFSTTTGNGMESDDTVIISVSTDGGTTYTQELLLKGSTNNYWGFDAVRTASTAYNGDGTPVSFTSGSLNNPTTGGISYLELTGIPNSADLVIKVEMKNSDSKEIWVIDDAEIWGN